MSKAEAPLLNVKSLLTIRVSDGPTRIVSAESSSSVGAVEIDTETWIELGKPEKVWVTVEPEWEQDDD